MNEIYRIFKKNLTTLLEGVKNSNIAVAVSGGSDSVALLYLLHNLNTKLNITVLTVNHNLRQESKTESEYVISIAKKLGIYAYKLDWDAKGNFSNLQSRARAGRYELISEYCLKNNISVLLTAHHLDDKIENFLIRQKRKSSIFGLSSSNCFNFNGIKIIRPLHNISKQHLINYLHENNIKWLEDESNLSDKYERNKIRKILASSEGLKDKIIKKQTEVDEKIKYLKNDLNEALKRVCNIYNYGFAIIKLKDFGHFEFDVKFQIISYILTIIGGNLVTPRGRVLRPTLSLLSLPQNFTKTLHGCSLHKIGDDLLIYRLFGKKPPPNLSSFQASASKLDNLKNHFEEMDCNVGFNVIPGNNKYWDNRFSFTGQMPQKSFISTLTQNEYNIIKNQINLEILSKLSFKKHIKILFTLPIVKNLEKVIAIPHISFYNDAKFEGKITFIPKYSSRFINLESNTIKNE